MLPEAQYGKGSELRRPGVSETSYTLQGCRHFVKNLRTCRVVSGRLLVLHAFYVFSRPDTENDHHHVCHG
jgi:hypothetical protein